MVRLSPAQAKAMGIVAPPKRPKYGNHKITIDGRTFDSRREASYYGELVMLKKAGIISDFECQPKFLLQPAFTCQGKHYRKIEYIADFKITYASGKVEVVDVKSEITRKNKDYRMKIKMLLYQNPTMIFREEY